jgi:hypothetical protein
MHGSMDMGGKMISETKELTSLVKAVATLRALPYQYETEAGGSEKKRAYMRPTATSNTLSLNANCAKPPQRD